MAVGNGLASTTEKSFDFFEIISHRGTKAQRGKKGFIPKSSFCSWWFVVVRGKIPVIIHWKYGDGGGRWAAATYCSA
jgi:hypothetical protein